MKKIWIYAFLLLNTFVSGDSYAQVDSLGWGTNYPAVPERMIAETKWRYTYAIHLESNTIIHQAEDFYDYFLHFRYDYTFEQYLNGQMTRGAWSLNGSELFYSFKHIKKFEIAQFLKDTQHPINDILSDPMLFKSYLNKIDIKARKQVMSVELYLEKLERSNAYKLEDLVDKHMYFALHKPHSSLSVQHQDLIWKLLVNISPKDVLFLYWYDKDQFYKSYETWDDSFKDWVIKTISNNI